MSDKAATDLARLLGSDPGSDDVALERDLVRTLAELKAARAARSRAAPPLRAVPVDEKAAGGWAQQSPKLTSRADLHDLSIPPTADERSVERFLANADRPLTEAELRNSQPKRLAPKLPKWPRSELPPQENDPSFSQPFSIKPASRAPKPPAGRDHLGDSQDRAFSQDPVQHILRAEPEPAPATARPELIARDVVVEDIFDLTDRAPPLLTPIQRERLWPGFLMRSVVFAALMAAIWGPTKFYIENAPRSYESNWRIILPGEGVKAGVRLIELGEARTSSRSQFESRDYDARATYREIAASSIVKSAAAEAVGLAVADFEDPKILAIPQTAILQFRIRRASPEAAQRHAKAYMASFDRRVDALRRRELGVRQGVAEQNIDGLRVALDRKRTAKLDVQRNRGLQSEAQFKSLVANTDELAMQLTTETLDLRALENKFEALAAALNITPEFAALALTLKGDRLFQTLSEAYVEAERELIRLRGNLGERHPDLVTARVRRDEFRLDVVERSRVLIGTVPPEIERVMDLTQSAERGSLFAELLETKATLEGQRARVGSLSWAVDDARYRLPSLAEDAALLTAADQEARVAEAVYASALASVDFSTSDPYASYPLYQVLDEPDLPVEPVSPKIKVAIAGAAAATLFVIMAFAVLWYRRRLRRARLRKLASSGPSG